MLVPHHSTETTLVVSDLQVAKSNHQLSSHQLDLSVAFDQADLPSSSKQDTIPPSCYHNGASFQFSLLFFSIPANL